MLSAKGDPERLASSNSTAKHLDSKAFVDDTELQPYQTCNLKICKAQELTYVQHRAR